MKTRTALITGAYGFIGRNIARLFGEKGWNVIGMGHGVWLRTEWTKWKIAEWNTCDITIDSLQTYAGDPDVIVHCAGGSSVGFSVSHPAEDFNRTVSSTLAVLEYMRLFNNTAQLIYPSSAAVYGRQDDRQLGEDEPLSPVSPYGYHKKIAEDLCKSYSDNYELRVSIIRFFSLYGEGLRKQLLWEACGKFSRGEEQVMFFGSGEETRDWLHVLDAVKLILLRSESSDRFSIVNGGSGERVTIREILEYMSNEYGAHQSVLFNGVVRKGDPNFYRADTTRAVSLGWKPSVDWRQGVRDYVKWYQGACRG